MEIKIVKFEEIEPLEKLAKRDGVTMANPPGAVWIAATEDGKTMGWVCVVINPKTKSARFKSDLVVEEYRNRRIYQKLFMVRLKYAQMKGAKSATAYCGPLSIRTYLRYGFNTVKRIGNTENIFVKRLFI